MSLVDSPDLMSASSETPEPEVIETVKTEEVLEVESPEGETAEEVETEETEEVAESEEIGNESPAEPKQKRNKVQERIDKLTKRAKEAERKAEALENQIARPNLGELGEKPTLEGSDFDVTKYESDLADWTAKKSQIDVSQKHEAERLQVQTDEFQRKGAEFATKNPDYFQAISQTQVQNPVLAKAILGLDNGVELAYHLATNPDVMSPLNSPNADPVRVGMELQRITTQLNSKPQPTPKLTTKAPAPIVPITSKVSPQKHPSKMSNKEYQAWRVSQT